MHLNKITVLYVIHSTIKIYNVRGIRRSKWDEVVYLLIIL
jgi:hypothetical protein